MESNVGRVRRAGLASFLLKNRYICLLVGITLLFCAAPLAVLQVPVGHDLAFHLNRIVSFAVELQNGNPFPAIFHSVFHGAGYAAPLFYGNLPLVFPAILVCLGVPLLTAYKLNLVLITLAAALVAYSCGKRMLKNELGAFVVSVLFVFSAYFASDAYYRSALGETSAFVFVPIAFLGLNELLFAKEGHAWLFLPIGLALTLYCHLLSGPLVVFGLLLYALCFIDAFFREPKRLWKLLFSVLIFFALSAFFLFPMLEQLSSATFLATDGFSATANGLMSETAMPIWAVFCDLNRVLAMRFGISDGFWIPNGLGLPFLLTLILSIFFMRGKPKRSLFTCLTLCLVTLLSCTSLFPWGSEALQRMFGVLQFPWRLLIIATFFLALCAGIWVAAEANPKRARLAALLLVLCSLTSYTLTAGIKLYSSLKNLIQNTPIKYATTDFVGFGEYLPSGLSFDTFPLLYGSLSITNEDAFVSLASSTVEEQTILFSGNQNGSDATAIETNLFFSAVQIVVLTLPDGTQTELPFTETEYGARIQIGSVASGTLTLKLKPVIHASDASLAAQSDVSLSHGRVDVSLPASAEKVAWVEVPLLYYKGYVAVFTNAQGEKKQIPIVYGENKLCRVALGETDGGTLSVSYKRTAVQQISLIVTLCSFASLFGYAVFCGVQKRRIARP